MPQISKTSFKGTTGVGHTILVSTPSPTSVLMERKPLKMGMSAIGENTTEIIA